MNERVGAAANLIVLPGGAAGPASAARWSATQRLVFRFVFSYVALYGCTLIDNSDFDLPWLSLEPLWNRLVPWVGHHLFRLHQELANAPNGSGDTLYDWVRNGTYLVLAVVATIAWSALDRRRAGYPRLWALLHTGVRYAVAYQMLSYGFAKVFRLQFSDLGPGQLGETYGEASPMGLLWTFMGASAPYTLFGGAAELLGGLLLLWRRTTTLGALVVVAVMTNVVMLNFCYDVPVKLLSSHLVLLALLLAAPDARRLVDVLVLHRATAAQRFAWRPRSPRRRWARRLVKSALIAGGLGMMVYQGVQAKRLYGSDAPRPANYGRWDVAEERRAGMLVPPSLTDGARWRWAYFNRGWGGLVDAGGRTLGLRQPTDDKDQAAAKDTLELTTPRDAKVPQKARFHVRAPDGDHLVLDGTWDGAPLVLTLVRHPDDSLLLHRGFHLVNEFPFNR